MPVPLIPCRHTETGEVREIPETALYLFADWKPIDKGEAPPKEQVSNADGDSSPSSSADEQTAPPKQASTGRTSKAASSAKKPEED